MQLYSLNTCRLKINLILSYLILIPTNEFTLQQHKIEIIRKFYSFLRPQSVKSVRAGSTEMVRTFTFLFRKGTASDVKTIFYLP